MKGLIDYRRILRETIEEYMNITFDDVKQGKHKMRSLYQVAFKDRLKSIFRNGFSIQFASTAGGNFYCTGLYSTFKLDSTIDNLRRHPDYGDCILKFGIESFDRFLIYNKKIAMETYGENYSIEKQLDILFKDYPEKLQYIKNHHSYGYIVNTDIGGYSSNKVQEFLKMMGGMLCACDKQLEEYDIRGFIFHGANDGYVCIIRDYKSIIPLVYSEDGGKTWKDDLFTETTIDNSAKSKDPIRFLGKEYVNYIDPKFYTEENGWWLVRRKSDKRYNLINDETKEFMLPIWFISASKVDENGFSMVKTDEGEKKYVNEYGIYSLPNQNSIEISWEEWLEGDDDE